MSSFLTVMLIFFLSTSAFYVGYVMYTKKRRINRRMNHFMPKQQASVKEEEEVEEEKTVKPWLRSFSQPFAEVKLSKKTVQTLQQAGSVMKPEEFFGVRLLFAIGLGVVFLLLGFSWYLFLFAAFMGFYVPLFYMKQKAKKRLKNLTYQLVETLGTMSNSLRAGFSFVQTMQLVGKEMPDPIGPEFERAVKEIGMGIPMEEVFRNLLIRLPNKELEVVVQALLAQRKSGGNLAKLLDTMEETIRGRVRVLEELKTLTAQGKLSSWIITLLPVFLGFYMYVVNPKYFEPMLGHPLGIMMLTTGGIFILIGWFFIQKIIKIEV
ncbi:type II secretion system F family protein [Bacillus timonensis]|nr:type II secretion system F family protein [Bacillus timonensis]